MDLPARPPDCPLVVGRADDVDLQLPAVTTAPRHCVFFVRDGHWHVQDGGSGRTFVNDVPARGPTRLRAGDVVRAGTGRAAPTIEIEPGASASAPALAGPAVEGAPVALVPAQPDRRAAPAAPAAPAPPAAPFGSTVSAVRHEMPEVAAGDLVDWRCSDLPDSNPPGPAHTRAPAPAFPAVGSAGVALLIIAASVAGVAIAWRRHVAVPAVPVLLDSPPAMASPRRSPGAGPSPAPIGEAVSAVALVPAAPGRGDEAWEDVELAHHGADPALALAKFDDFAQQQPGRFADRLRAYTEDALDALWWQRITGLCQRRARLTREIAGKEPQLAAEADERAKLALASDLAELRHQRDLAGQALRACTGWSGDSAPDVGDPAELARLAGPRDPKKFARWRWETLAYIRSHHGRTPWAAEE